MSTTNIVVDRAKNNVRTLFPPKKQRRDPHIFPIYSDFHPISMFIGQGLSLEARHAAQAERRSANTATAPASAAAAAAAERASSAYPPFFALLSSRRFGN